MNNIISEDLAIADLLRKQYEVAKILDRQFTGYGFFTDFEIMDKSLRIPDNMNREVGNTQAVIEGLKLGVGFVLYIRNGFIKTLEGYTYDEPWPKNITSYSLNA
jgi:hypothetical protein